MSSKVKVLVLRAPGTNCDGETIFAFEEAGGVPSLVTIGELIRKEQRLCDFQILVIPGGFSYGDDISGGKVFAGELKLTLAEDVPDFIKQGGLILGVCNGLQVLVKTNILPGFDVNGLQPVTLTNNDSGKFECRWVHLAAEKDSPCVFTRGIERMDLPVAHGEGKLVALPGVLPRIHPVLYYADAEGNRTAKYPDNPNGSVDDIAGICDDTGQIFALMPHPERHIRATQHPQWTRTGRSGRGDGFKIFKNAVNWAEKL